MANRTGPALVPHDQGDNKIANLGRGTLGSDAARRDDIPAIADTIPDFNGGAGYSGVGLDGGDLPASSRHSHPVDDPEVEIILAAGETATLTVRDNGAGIEDFDALFEPFYTTKQAGDGVGLGLAISSGIVNDFGGRLTARNSPDGGAVFEVRLPISPRDAGTVKAAE